MKFAMMLPSLYQTKTHKTELLMVSGFHDGQSVYIPLAILAPVVFCIQEKINIVITDLE